MYRKISKWIFWILAIVSVTIMVWGASSGFTAKNAIPVDFLLKWAYILFAVAIALVIVLGLILGAMTDPKSLKTLGLGIVIIAVLTLIAYFTASGDALVGYMGVQPSAKTLKITDTLLNLVYLLGAGAVIAILLGETVRVIRNK